MILQIDRLEERAFQTRQDKIDALNELAWKLRNVDRDRAVLPSAEAHELATTGEFSEQTYRTGVAASLRVLALWNIRDGLFSLGAGQVQKALSYLEITPHPVLRADLLALLARANWGLGSYPEALDCGLKGLKSARLLGDLARQAFALDTLGVIYNHAHRFKPAVGAQKEALQLYRSCGDEYGEALVLNNLADTYLNAGSLDEALSTANECLQFARARDLSQATMAVNGTLGQIHIAMRNYEDAKSHIDRALALSTRLDSKHLGVAHRMSLGVIAKAQRDTQLARKHFEQALTMAREIGERSKQARCFEHLAEIHELEGDFRSALEAYKRFHKTMEMVLSGETSSRIADIQSEYEMEHVHQLAFFDSLTQLPNRRLLVDRLNQAIAASNRNCQYNALVFIDLDNFKPLNDTHGHGVGDLMLIDVANRLRAHVREADTVARFGGDEFVVLLNGLDLTRATSIEKVRVVAEKIRTSLSEPYRLPVQAGNEPSAVVEHKSSASIGVMLFANGEGCPDEILKRADAAMYRAKRSGRNSITFY